MRFLCCAEKHNKTWHVYYIIAWEQIFCRSLFTCLQAGVPSFCLMASRGRLVWLQNVVGHIEKPNRDPRAENIQKVQPRSISSSDICWMSVRQRQCPQISADFMQEIIRKPDKVTVNVPTMNFAMSQLDSAHCLLSWYATTCVQNQLQLWFDRNRENLYFMSFFWLLLKKIVLFHLRVMYLGEHYSHVLSQLC